VIAIVLGVISVVSYLARQNDDREFANTTELARIDNESKNFKGAANLWMTYGDSTSNQDHKAAAYINAASQYVAGRQFADATLACRRAEAVNGITFKEAEVAATAYSALGDKPNAIKYYNEAIRLFPATIADRSATIASFHKAIQELQK